ncbi:TBC domain-containing protein [Cladobotryum mycophilum]|uniref:TBC domain-containing protein n=1 Tax=Cladobotryum mycophilum TaxID=491253 RepID=A0ABR0SYD7_9HYPO
MISTKFGSIRSRSGSNSKKGPEITLVGVRYEKTVQAEPPKPMPPRNSSRVPSRAPSTRSPTPSSPTSMYSPSLSSHSPIVVAPPLASITTVAPPAEQHPALRTPVQQTKAAEGWKRDSGHAPTPTSSATIREEDNEDDGEECGSSSSNGESAPWSAAIDKLIRAGIMPSSVVQHLDRRAAAEDKASAGLKTSSGDEHVCPTEDIITSASPSTTNLHSSVHTISPQQLSRHLSVPPASPSRRANLLKRFSVRSSASSSAKGKLPPVLINEGSSAVPPPITPLTPLESPTRIPPSPPAPANMQPPPLELPQSPSTISLQSWAAVPATTPKSQGASPSSEDPQYTPLGLSIPTVGLLDDDSMATLSFSNRGSIMFGGRRVAGLGSDGTAVAEPQPQPNADPTPLSNEQSITTTTTTTTATDSDDAATTTTSTAPRAPLPPPDIRVLSVDVEKESQKVRSLYGVGDAISWEDGVRHSYCEPLSPTPEDPIEDDGNDSLNREAHGPAWAILRSTSSFAHHKDSKLETELAGGIEDWEDVDGGDVDRYGFIAVPRTTSRAPTPTYLGVSRLSPKRRNVLHKRDPMGLSVRRTPSRKISARSLRTQNSEMSIASMRSSRSVIRQAGNLLPHNRDRRWMDEAGEMLTVSPNLQDALEEAEIQRISESLKRKEWERSEKWRKMAKIVRRGGQGEGMEFEFDIKNPKLIDRTWKAPGLPLEADIISAFYRLLEQGSPDDVQIDLDVPRTISRHIMFRRRYRGGQRLLFRVLHALSIYFPETGYVQGMASLAATLLCYFDEEKCFVMLVRMWQLRGLDRLYRPGFEGLMTALREFEETWLNKDVAKKLTELSVDITAYGTRWYLTLFNLSIPFPAQLRVWDVYLLLGDGAFTAQSTPSQGTTEDESNETSGLDVLHATSAALVQALREVLLDSDFENAMKSLTSWIPIKDEDLLMRVTKAEWKSRQGKKKT